MLTTELNNGTIIPSIYSDPTTRAFVVLLNVQGLATTLRTGYYGF